MPKRNPLTEMNHVNDLFDVYGALLTKLQQAMMSDYYRYNLSLKEIAEQRRITRAAVSDALTQAKLHVLTFEKTLKVLELQTTLKQWLSDESLPPKLKAKLKQMLNR